MNWFSRIVVIGISLFFTLSIVGYMYLAYGLPWKHNEMKQHMDHYLEERYKDEFELGSIRFDWLHGGSYFTTATAKTTGVSFYVETSTDGTTEDMYSDEYWTHHGDQLIWPIIKRYYTVFEGVSIGLRFDEVLPVNLPLEEHKAYTWWDVNVHIAQALEDHDIEKAFFILQALQQDGFKVEQFYMGFYDVAIQVFEEQIPLITDKNELAKFVKTYEDVY
ncbi:hypothetical protein AAGS61_08090 [Lysinibacillus sp. KU-BSD001]|uniref:hypothetical protein n=1 Tax=Lysinibacillus sp. KU-BSD001 TaxID=3141328 RepID=UPI0036F10F80